MFFDPRFGDLVCLKREPGYVTLKDTSEIGFVQYVLPDGQISVLWSKSGPKMHVAAELELA